MTILAMLLALSATESAFDFTHLDCAKASTTPETNECARRDHESVEARLNQAYKLTLAGLTEGPDALEARKQLVLAQREWIAFRELDCRAKHALHQSGTIRTLVYFDCMDSHSKARIAQFEHWADPSRFAAIDSVPAGGHDNAATWVKSAIDDGWVARAGDSGSVVVTSPGYAMPFNQGCVIHELTFLDEGGRPSLGQMVANDLYFVFASGDACASANREQYFDIEPANDVVALLDFARRLKGGPRPGKDRIADGDLARVSQCFASEAMATTRIVRAHSWRQKGIGRDDRYQVTVGCKALEDQGDILVSGARDQDAVTWKTGELDRTAIDTDGDVR